MKINEEIILNYEKELKKEDKAEDTVSRYVTEIRRFAIFVGNREISQEVLVEYKNYLINKHQKAKTVNVKLSALNGFFKFIEHPEIFAKFQKEQNSAFRSEEKELTEKEYHRLVQTAYQQKKDTLALIIQTICATGIRVSELQFITVKTVKDGEASVFLKAKERKILIPRKLRQKLLDYIRKNNIEGIVFKNEDGSPLNRKVIWAWMKSICEDANVNPMKVFPHNLRHLFAVEFYKKDKDIVKLADVLGHSNINTTRIYLKTTGREHQKLMDTLPFVF